jgi:large subunit ribosomal protein L22
MGKEKAPRRLGDDSAQAIASAIRTSPRKLNLVAASIRGKKVADAVVALDFTKRRVAKDVKRVLQAAIAENNHQLDVDKLVVASATVGRAFVMKRWMARGRGKSAGVEKPFSNLTVVVQEKDVPVLAKRTIAPKKSGAKVKIKTETSAAAAPKADAAQAGA